MSAAGLVSLVGAGPGDPELITLKGRARLEQADSVLYDDLANPALLEWAPAEAERLYVGKRRGRHSATQEQIADWLIERAARGLRVVRLKGGDPFLFGRGGEEVEALARAGMAWEVIPGISAANGAAASACLPLTHRSHAGSVAFTTGAALAGGGGESRPDTLVVFMGAANAAAWTRRLLRRGWAAETPVAVVEHATLPAQRVLASTLDRVVAEMEAAMLRGPVIVIVGEAAAWRESLGDARRCAAATAVVRPAGLILMAHGSPLPGWQTGVEQLAAAVALPGQFSRAAFLPPVSPSLGEVVASAHEAGVDELVVVPYFLAGGVHVTRDIPELVEAERVRFPGLRIRVSACLEGHGAMRTAVLARFQEQAAR